MAMKWNSLRLIAMFLISLLLIQVSVNAVDPLIDLSQQTSNRPFNGSAMSNFLNHRCGSSFKESSRPSIWIYEGTLTDPLSGKVIAEVEGLELAKQLPTLTRSSSTNNDRTLLNNLCTNNVLFPKENAKSLPPSWDTATTILSRKLFCYRRPSTTHDHALGKVGNEASAFSPSKALLTSLRLRPDGPLRHLSTLENMAVYDSAITYITRNNGREMVVFTELAGGKANNPDTNGEYDLSDDKKHYIMGSAQMESDTSRFSFAIQALKGTLNNEGDRGPGLPPLKQPTSSNGRNDEVVISPPRSRLLQLGKGDGSGGDNTERKYRTVRESYSYSFHDRNDTTGKPEQNGNDKPSKLFDFTSRLRKHKLQSKGAGQELQMQMPCTVKYSRYGEAPPWYAPGRHCTLELHGKRLADNDSTRNDLPPLISWAASKSKPKFWSGWPTMSRSGTSHSDEHVLAKQAIQLFCKGSRPFIDPNDDLSERDQLHWVSIAENTLSRVQNRLKYLSKSFIVSELPS